MAELKDLIAAKDELSSRLLRNKKHPPAVALVAPRAIRDARTIAGRNLHAVGVGHKIVDGKRTQTLCVRLYVLEKAAESALPRSARLPESIAGLPTDVIESPLAMFHAPACSVHRRKRQRRPIRGGISAAHTVVAYSATLGCFCSSNLPSEAGQQFILGCNHAFANLSSAPLGSPILQPSSADGGSASSDRVARLRRVAPMHLNSYTPIRADAAIAQVVKKVAKPIICSIGPLTGIVAPFDGMKVRKHGRTTGYTEGVVTDVAMDAYVVDYVGGFFATFANMFQTEPTLGYVAPPDESAYNGDFASPGDSGSIIVERTSQRAVGLHIGGKYGISVANPIKDVCGALKITIP